MERKKKMNKITVNTIDEFVKSRAREDIKIQVGDDMICIRTDFDLDEAETFVNRVAGAVVNESGYHPAAFYPVFVATVFQMFSNANVPTKKIDISGEKTSVLDFGKISAWAREFFETIIGNKCFNELGTNCYQKVEFLLKEREKDTVVSRFIQRLSDELDRMQMEHDMGAADVLKSMAIQTNKEE